MRRKPLKNEILCIFANRETIKNNSKKSAYRRLKECSRKQTIAIKLIKHC